MKGNLASKREKSGTVGSFDKAGGVDTICIVLKDVDPEKLYRSDRTIIFIFIIAHQCPYPILKLNRNQYCVKVFKC